MPTSEQGPNSVFRQIYLPQGAPQPGWRRGSHMVHGGDDKMASSSSYIDDVYRGRGQAIQRSRRCRARDVTILEQDACATKEANNTAVVTLVTMPSNE